MKSLKLVQGWGVNDVQKLSVGENRTYYKIWSRMLERAYSKSWQQRYEEYKGTQVSEEWKYLSSFIEWASKQYWQGNDLDKDLLVEGNKLYSKDTCIFLPPTINKALMKHTKESQYLMGVGYEERSHTMVNPSKKPYTARCRVGESVGSKFLGMYATEVEAHNAWRLAKAENLIYWAEKWKTDIEMKKSFRHDGYEALYRRVGKLRNLEVSVVQDW